MNKLVKELFKYKDEHQAKFFASLTLNIDKKFIVGVKVPNVRIVAKQFLGTSEAEEFLNNLPHEYCDENMLHSILISLTKDYKVALKRTNEFLPYVDNWAVCDVLSPKCFKKHKDDLIKNIKIWIKSKHTYTIRFGIEMLMSFFLDDAFKTEYLDLVSVIRSNEYYVNMMIAWFFATALSKQYDLTFPYIKNKKLDDWTHNKTIQKAIESYRITEEQKEILRKLKVNKK